MSGHSSYKTTVNATKRRRLRSGLGVVVAAGMGFALLPTTAAGAAQPGVGCSVSALKAAITSANAASGHQVISLAPGCAYALSTADNAANGLPVITGDLAIQGRGATIRRTASAPAFRLIKVADTATLSLTDLSLTGGLAKDDCADDPIGGIVACGGAIENFGALALERVNVSNNEATGVGDGGYLEGGAVENFGTATVKAALFVSNTADYTGTTADTLVSGGAISNENGISIDGTSFVASKVSATGATGSVPNGGEVYGSAFVNWGAGSLTAVSFPAAARRSLLTA